MPKIGISSAGGGNIQKHLQNNLLTTSEFTLADPSNFS